MSVNVSSYKAYNSLYDSEMYTGHYQGYLTPFNANRVDYWGYANAIDPHIIPYSEVETITGAGVPSNTNVISGTPDGFSAVPTWRTSSHIIAIGTANPNIKLAIFIARHDSYMRLEFAYYPGTGNNWITSTFFVGSSSWGAQTFYLNLPKFFYLFFGTRSDSGTDASRGLAVLEMDNGTFDMSTNQNITDFFTNGGTLVSQAPDSNPLPLPNTDPYKPGGNSSEGGGTGNFDGTSDSISIPGLPSLSATDAGFITLFNPSMGELRSLATYMWGTGFDLNTFKKIFADPMDCMLGLSIVPVAVPNGSSKELFVGNIGTGINMTVAGSQYVAVDCGTINVNEYWGAYLDYDPYTKAELYLPYIGTHPLAVDDIMKKAVHVVYHVDILSGACVAYVQCGSSVLYSFIGQCSSSIPISGNDWTNVINGVLSVAGSIGSMVATGGASAPLAVPGLAATAVNGLKQNVEKSGAMAGTGGMMGIQTPYLILTRPRQALPKHQNRFTGYPSFITTALGEISGYTEVETVHLENVPATDNEMSEIESLLKSGVIL